MSPVGSDLDYLLSFARNLTFSCRVVADLGLHCVSQNGGACSICPLGLC